MRELKTIVNMGKAKEMVREAFPEQPEVSDQSIMVMDIIGQAMKKQNTKEGKQMVFDRCIEAL